MGCGATCLPSIAAILASKEMCPRNGVTEDIHVPSEEEAKRRGPGHDLRREPEEPGSHLQQADLEPGQHRVMPALGPDERAVAGSGCLRGELSVEYRLQLPAEKLPGADRHADPLPGQREALPRGIARDEEWADDGVAEARGQEPAVILTGRQAELR